MNMIVDLFIVMKFSDILIHRGDLSKNRFFRENPNNIYKPMNVKAFSEKNKQ